MAKDGTERGRPVSVWTPERLAEVKDALEKYTEENHLPILAEFCYLNNVNKTHIYDYDDLAEGIKKLTAKKEANLERGALGGSMNPSMAIFSLKQLGWTDRKEVEHSGGVSIHATPQDEAL